ncbi:NAD(P)-binding protein [Stipitochalara longipes BDJ]|nr:NAD(P)-binding protein [Stipitochalara longipes BDJ]
MANSIVFITGATGFIGSHVARAALGAGYRIRLSIRKHEQAQKIAKYYPEYTSKIETVVIPDMTKSASFESALSGIDYVFHLASPMPGSGSDIKLDYVDPAVQSTEAILYAAMTSPSIKKVIIVSSALALAPIDALLATNVTVKDNTGEVIPVNLEMALPEGPAGHALRYSASKILAHQATRDFLKKRNPKYTLITFHPTLVLGHSLTQDSGDISGSNGMVWQPLFSEKPTAPAGWVHVRDVADAHIKALKADIETGMEFLLSGSKPASPWEEIVSFVKSQYPGLGWKLRPPFEGGWEVDVSRAEQVLQIDWRSKEDMVRDIVEQQLSFRQASA